MGVVPRRLLTLWLVSGQLVTPAAWALRNGAFDQGLREWKAAWPVATLGGEAVLTDAQANHAFLFQADALGVGSFTVAFDFFDGLAADVPAGAQNDSFYASVYYVDELSDFITEHDKFDASQGLLDLDANGTFNVNGTLSESTKGEGWSRFTGTLTSSHTYVVIVFELYDLNFTRGDSEARVDNVNIWPGAP